MAPFFHAALLTNICTFRSTGVIIVGEETPEDEPRSTEIEVVVPIVSSLLPLRRVVLVLLGAIGRILPKLSANWVETENYRNPFVAA